MTERNFRDKEATLPLSQDLTLLHFVIYLFISLSPWLPTNQYSTADSAINEPFGPMGWSPSRMREWAAWRIQGVLQEELFLGRGKLCDRWSIRHTSNDNRSESAGRVQCLDNSVYIQRGTEIAITVHSDRWVYLILSNCCFMN